MMKHSGTSPGREEGLRGCRDEGQGCCLGEDSSLPTPENCSSNTPAVCHPETNYLYLYPPHVSFTKKPFSKGLLTSLTVAKYWNKCFDLFADEPKNIRHTHTSSLGFISAVRSKYNLNRMAQNLEIKNGTVIRYYNFITLLVYFSNSMAEHLILIFPEICVMFLWNGVIGHTVWAHEEHKRPPALGCVWREWHFVHFLIIPAARDMSRAKDNNMNSWTKLKKSPRLVDIGSKGGRAFSSGCSGYCSAILITLCVLNRNQQANCRTRSITQRIT